jgi:hypothetical protein
MLQRGARLGQNSKNITRHFLEPDSFIRSSILSNQDLYSLCDLWGFCGTFEIRCVSRRLSWGPLMKFFTFFFIVREMYPDKGERCQVPGRQNRLGEGLASSFLEVN